MVTRLWVFPGGEVITLATLDADIARLKLKVEAVIVTEPRLEIPVQGMVDQMYDYALEIQTHRTLLRITGRKGARTRSGKRAHPGTQTFALPDDAVQAPIMSSKYDGNNYLFALVEVREQ